MHAGHLWFWGVFLSLVCLPFIAAAQRCHVGVVSIVPLDIDWYRSNLMGIWNQIGIGLGGSRKKEMMNPDMVFKDLDTSYRLVKITGKLSREVSKKTGKCSYV